MLTGGFGARDESYLRHTLAVVHLVCFDRRFSEQAPEIHATYPHIHDVTFPSRVIPSPNHAISMFHEFTSSGVDRHTVTGVRATGSTISF